MTNRRLEVTSRKLTEWDVVKIVFAVIGALAGIAAILNTFL